ncbi:MAG: type II toxin-antitoxin system HigB family toxin [Chitinophagaceae bacterium]|nr:type II toxin-antitoxin system HigB family toxin [Chitinophagaceae bacterium]
MVVISYGTLKVFYEKHPDAEEALNNWYRLALSGNWSQLADIKQVFNSVDYVGNDRFVFNIRGNKYRLVVMIFFNIRTIFIRFVGTHAEYDKIDSSVI